MAVPYYKFNLLVAVKNQLNLIDTKVGFFYPESNLTNELESISATWVDFQSRHVVSSDQGSAANWNAYFSRQMPSEYGNKSVNTFVVNSASLISKNFPSGVPQVNELNQQSLTDYVYDQ